MKNTINYLLLVSLIWLVSIQNVYSQPAKTIYTYYTPLDQELLIGFTENDSDVANRHGLQIRSFTGPGKATVSVKTSNKVHREINETCEINEYMTLYEAYVDTGTGGLLAHNGNRGKLYSRIGCFKDVATDNPKKFTRANMGFTLTAMQLNHDGFNSVREHELLVKVTLTVEGSVKLSDVIKVKVPGIQMLLAQDFIKQTAYTVEHGCSTITTGVCEELNKVRSIQDLNKTDMIIQAHRGIWGKPNTNQENTIGAMQVANEKGFKLLESDIIPIGINNLYLPNDPATYGSPTDLVAFHDYVLDRYTDAVGHGYIIDKTRAYVERLTLKKPRSEDIGVEKVMFFDELLQFGKDNDLIVCVDMKSLESKGSSPDCVELCNWESQELKNLSLSKNIKLLISKAPYLNNLVIKTYAKYDDLKTALTSGDNALSKEVFSKILWAPMLVPKQEWQINSDLDPKRNPDHPDILYNPKKIQKHLDEWFAHNESVLYYETNFFNDHDKKSSVMLDEVFCYRDRNGQDKCVNIMEYIYRMTGRRAGIFSEEPVGSKGNVNRWGSWKIKNPESDRRGDHIWLLKQPFFKHAVITTDRPSPWEQLND